ncbi:dicarboxylate/amino acid:cation symporter [Thermosulfuriphilus sp.]
MKALRSVENQTLLAIFLGLILGHWLPEVATSIKLVGDLFLRLLKMIIAPLIFASVFISLSGLGSIRKIKEIGGKTTVYYLATTSLSVATGLILVNIARPGGEIKFNGAGEVAFQSFGLRDLILGIVPANPVKSLAEGEVLPIIFFALILGLATLSLEKSKRENLFSFFEALNDALIALIRGIIRLTPLGVMAIVANIVAEKGLAPIFHLWEYALTVAAGLCIHAGLTLALLLAFLGKTNPWQYFLSVREALLVAFSTASSSATLPISLEVAEEKAGVPKKVAGFVLPLGATINMDGTALYEAIAAMFIANAYQIDLSFSQQVIIFLTATLASIGAAGIPSAGLVTMTMVLQAVGLPLEGIGLILAVDRFLDMLRTAINVWGDLIGARIISRLADS